MYRKKFGKMTVSGWLNAELEQSSLLACVLGAILTAACCLLVRLLAGSPYRIINELGIRDLVPPVWLMSLLRLLSFGTSGAACGLILGCRNTGCPSEKYQAGFQFLLLAILELAWYPTLFCGGLVFWAVLESICILCLSVSVTHLFFRISKFSGWILLFHTVWVIYLMILTFSIFFKN